MVDVNGVRTHFQRMPARNAAEPAELAEPPQVVFVHGIGYDSLASFYLTLAAPVAEAGIDVLTYDLRGHGRSDRPYRGYRVGDFVADLECLLDALRIERPVHVVGNSFGGTVAFGLAAARPERVASIVSIEAEPATDVWAERMRRTLGNVVDEMAAEENLAWLAETFGSHHARLARVAGIIMRSTTMATDLPDGPMLAVDDLRGITCPVLSIVGSEGFHADDPLALQQALPDCRTEVIDGQSHSVLVERHRTVRELLLRWIRRHELPGRRAA